MLNIESKAPTGNGIMGTNLELKRSPHTEEVTAEVVTLTPELATDLLNRNPDNRNVTHATVQRYAADITEGRWVFNGEPVIVADTGELNDGQHRCVAVELAGKPITTLIVYGVPRAARFSTDMGNARTTGHMLHMSGIPNSNEIARAAGLLHQADRNGSFTKGGGGRSSRHITKTMVLDYAHQHMAEMQAAYDVVGVNGSNMIGTTGVLVAVFALIARRAGYKPTADFFTKLIEGANIGTSDPIYVARQRLIKERMEGHVPPTIVAEIILRGWNLHRKGRTGRIAVMGEWPKIAS